MTPEGRAYAMGVMRDQAQRDHERYQQHSWQSQQALNSPFQRQRQSPTYYVRPDPLYRGGSIVTPNRFGY